MGLIGEIRGAIIIAFEVKGEILSQQHNKALDTSSKPGRPATSSAMHLRAMLPRASAKSPGHGRQPRALKRSGSVMQSAHMPVRGEDWSEKTPTVSGRRPKKTDERDGAQPFR